MAGQKMKASGSRADLPRAVIDLAQGNEAATEGDALDTGAADVELMLSDLVGDANGEVVIFDDSGLRTLRIRANAAVVAEGRATRHVTASGEDVSGFRYVRFDNGMTLYFREGLDLILKTAARPPTP